MAQSHSQDLKYHQIPTNIITGFLGVGKTTLIRALLKNKPGDERWAVLVNEFGEVGIDGALFDADDIAVKEVAGGCMCCSVGLPSRVALNKLIKTHNPDRILIEPTGLAHPKQVLEMFSGTDYDGVLDMRAVVCLVDPWCLSQDKFLDLPAFIEQIQMADVLLATKKDNVSQRELEGFYTFAQTLKPEKVKVDAIAQGNMPWEWLDTPHTDQSKTLTHQSHSHTQIHKPLIEDSIRSSDHAAGPEWTPASESIQRIENEAEYGFSCGWRFPAETCFDQTRLLSCLSSIDVPRIKGVVSTPEGWLLVNKMRETISTEFISEARESRLEMIDVEKPDWIKIDQNLIQSILP